MDFEAYMPAEFNGAPYGVRGVLATADRAGIDVCVVFQGGVPADPRPGNAHLLAATRGEARILPGALLNPTMGPDALDDLRRCVEQGARTLKLMAATHGYRIDSPCVDLVLALARELGIPATIHSGSWLSGCSPVYIGDLAGQLSDRLLQIAVAGLGINHHGIQTFMPEQGGYLLQRNTRIDQVLAKRMAQAMWRYIL
jgi:predicted TIM-barrel fold metal-dependent hydrolase